MNFNWSAYCNNLFTENPGLTPAQYWEIAKRELTDEEKLIVFNQIGSNEIIVRHKNFVPPGFKVTPPTPDPVFDSIEIEDIYVPEPSKPFHAGGSVYNKYAELVQVKHTHNSSRGEQYVAYGKWTEQDFKCYVAYTYSGEYTTLGKKIDYAHSVQTIFMENPDAEVLEDIYPIVLERLGNEYRP